MKVKNEIKEKKTKQNPLKLSEKKKKTRESYHDSVMENNFP